MDSDNNHGIDLNEFYEAGKLAHSHDSSAWTMDKCKRHFSRIDANENGYISEDEFTQFLLKVTKNMNDEQFNTLINSYKGVRLEQDKQWLVAEKLVFESERKAVALSKQQIEEEKNILEQERSNIKKLLAQERSAIEEERQHLGLKMSQLDSSAAGGLFGEDLPSDPLFGDEAPPQTPRDTRRALGSSTWRNLKAEHQREEISVWVASVYVIGLPAHKRPALWR